MQATAANRSDVHALGFEFSAFRFATPISIMEAMPSIFVAPGPGGTRALSFTTGFNGESVSLYANFAGGVIEVPDTVSPAGLTGVRHMLAEMFPSLAFLDTPVATSYTGSAFARRTNRSTRRD